MFSRLFITLGTPIVSLLIYIGELVGLATETFGSIFAQKIRWRLFLQQIVEIGLRSQLVVMITGLSLERSLRLKRSSNSTSLGWDRR
jgi:ABC-type transporter Mla maintaining outer membrane lipid asymmetry permease subunit MlaE